MSLSELSVPSRLAMFLDFDGTLVELAERPDEVHLRPSTCRALADLERLLGGALAIVTGREIASIDRFLHPMRLPVAGIHGLVRRDAAGRMYMPDANVAFLARAAASLGALAARESGLLVEHKSQSIALHYRQRPDLEPLCLSEMERLANGSSGIVVKRGKMVVEAVSDGADKGSAVLAFMAEAPFSGRVPLVAGDDITDEDAFRVVNSLGGITIKIGAGPSIANFRADGTESFLAWLELMASNMATEAGEHERS